MPSEVPTTVIEPDRHRLIDRRGDDIEVTIAIDVSEDRAKDMGAGGIGAERANGGEVEIRR